jgi:hypothetical protein
LASFDLGLPGTPVTLKQHFRPSRGTAWERFFRQASLAKWCEMALAEQTELRARERSISEFPRRPATWPLECFEASG